MSGLQIFKHVNSEESRGEKNKLRSSLIKLRFTIRKSIAEYNNIRDDIRHFSRQKRKLEEKGMSFPILDARITLLRQQLEAADDKIVILGSAAFALLDFWQNLGATLADLCDLCGRRYNDVVNEIKPERIDEEFSDIMFVYCLDYKHDFSGSGFYSMDVDAPFSHSIKEYVLDMMINNPALKKATDEAFEKCFPEIAAKMFKIVEDAEGNTLFFDRDGNEIDPRDL